MPDPAKVRRFSLQIQMEDGALYELIVDDPKMLVVDIGGQQDTSEVELALPVIGSRIQGGRYSDFVMRAPWTVDTKATFIDHQIRSRAKTKNLGGQADG